ncbi:TBPIP domain containing protein [Amanita muscaria]
MSKNKADVKVLKGQDAEDAVLQYMKKMNRPYGAVDVSANMKGAVSKASAQKILVSLAEKGELVQKTYGKTTFFVANQDRTESIAAEKIASIEAEIKTIEAENTSLALQVKAYSAELGKLKSTPTDAELESRIQGTQAAINAALSRLEPLRSGTPIISPEDREQVQAEWLKWRAEWMRRKKVLLTFWQVLTETMRPQEAESLAEELGIEWDSGEHVALERSAIHNRKANNVLKRKRSDM